MQHPLRLKLAGIDISALSEVTIAVRIVLRMMYMRNELQLRYCYIWMK